LKNFLWLVVVLVVAGSVAAGVWWHLNGSTESSDSTASPESKPVADNSGADAFFDDVTKPSGVSFAYRNGQEADQYAILESLGGGIALIDYDGDGLLDIFLTGGGYFDGPDKKAIKGHPCALWKNLGDFRFRDVTQEAGLDRPWFYTHGAAVADYDRDGRPDLLVTGYGHIALFRNAAAAGHEQRRRFVDVTEEAGLPRDVAWGTSAAWGDLDGDGHVDLYVCQYVNWSPDNNPRCEGYSSTIPRDVCPPGQFEALPHLLFRNTGAGRFTDVGKQAGLRAPRKPHDYQMLAHLDESSRERLREGDWEKNFGKGLGVLIVDLDADGRPDVYVANDTTEKFLYLNRSSPGQVLLAESARELGVAYDDRGVPNGSMGLDAGDYDGSGRPSLLVTNYENELHGLYRNVLSGGRLAFDYSSYIAGIAGLGRQFVGFGTGFFDIDRDGWEDVVIANGHVIRHPTRSSVRQRPILLRNQGRGAGAKHVKLIDVGAQGGAYFASQHQARGVAIGDLDNDGAPDLVISHVNAPVAILRNQAAGANHWLGVELIGIGHRNIVGARLTLEVGDRRLTRFAKGGGSYLSSGDRRLLFGLGNETGVRRLTVAWPGGREQHWDGLKTNRYWRLEEDGK
jgi:hypothetical protein